MERTNHATPELAAFVAKKYKKWQFLKFQLTFFNLKYYIRITVKVKI